MALSLRDTLRNQPLNIKSFVDTINPQAISVSEMIAEEEKEAAKSNSNKLNQYFSDRSNIRKSMADWTLKTSKPAEDAFNVRTWKLIDLYLDAASKEVDENWNPKFTTEQIISQSKNLPWTLESMKKYYTRYAPDRVWAIDEYIQKWGIATNVFNYLEDMYWTRWYDNPYWADTKVERTNILEWLWEWWKWVVSAAWFLPNIWTKLSWQILSSKPFQWIDDKLYDTYHKIWDTATDEEYKQYKQWNMPEDIDTMNMWWVSKRQLYDNYDKALQQWFVWNINEYKDFEKKIDRATTDAVTNSLKEWMITKEEIESSKWALLWEAISEFLTYMLMPFNKKVIEVDSARPFINKIATAWVDALINTMDYAALEWAQWEIKEWDLWKVWLFNMLISSFLRWIWPKSQYTSNPALAKFSKDWQKFIRSFISTLPERVKNSFKNMDSATLKQLWEFAQKEAKDPEARWLTAKWLWEKWVKAVERLQSDIDSLWKQYEKKISWLTETVSEEWFFKDINDKFAELETQWAVSWGEWKAPKLELVKDWESFKIKISNKKNLNKIKNEDGKWLWDAIQENVNSILEWYWIKLNQWSEYLIKQWVANATKWTNWNVYEKQTQKLIEWLDNWDLNMPQEVKDLWDEIHYKKNLLSMAQKSLWVQWRYEASKVWQDLRYEDILKAWNKMSKDDAIAVIDILKRENYLPKDINSEILAQAYLLWIENKNAWYSFLEWYYPSKAWSIEQILELTRQHATRAEIERYIKMLEEQEKLMANKQWAWNISKISTPRAEIEKALWWWFLFEKPDKKRIEDTTYKWLTEEQKYEINKRYNEMYGL